MPSQPTLRPDNRLFVALDLPDELRDLLAAVGAQVARDAGGRAIPAENMHLTVAFLGTVPVAAGPQLCERLVEALAGPAPRLRPGRPVARPSPRRAQLVAVELDDVDGVLADMAARVERVCGDVLSGYTADRRPFWPHVTVARFRRPGDVRRFPPIEHEHVFDITRASLYDSHITPGEPPRYEALKEVMLDGSFAERSPSHG